MGIDVKIGVHSGMFSCTLDGLQPRSSKDPAGNLSVLAL